jgi:uncharacterized membrane protein
MAKLYGPIRRCGLYFCCLFAWASLGFGVAVRHGCCVRVDGLVAEVSLSRSTANLTCHMAHCLGPIIEVGAAMTASGLLMVLCWPVLHPPNNRFFQARLMLPLSSQASPVQVPNNPRLQIDAQFSVC